MDDDRAARDILSSRWRSPSPARNASSLPTRTGPMVPPLGWLERGRTGRPGQRGPLHAHRRVARGATATGNAVPL